MRAFSVVVCPFLVWLIDTKQFSSRVHPTVRCAIISRHDNTYCLRKLDANQSKQKAVIGHDRRFTDKIVSPGRAPCLGRVT